MKKLFSLLIALVLSFGATSSTLNEENHLKNVPKEPPLPYVIVVVPWSVDTLRIECASDIPPIIEPTVSSSCGMNDTSRSISTTFGACINERTIVRTWYYTDLCGDDTLVRQVIIVLDTIPPEVVVPWSVDTLRIACNDQVPPLIYPTVTDNCGLKDTTRTIETTFGACINKKFIKRTWRFRDLCDNETRAVQVIIVDDTIPPVVVVPWTEDTLRIDCNDQVPTLVYPTVTDNCGLKDTTRTIETTFGDCINKKFIKRTWRFRDHCDNETRAVQVIIVSDTIPPVVVVPWTEDTLRIDCNDQVPPLVYPTVTDNCGLKDTTRTIETTFGACINKKFIKRTWRFRDLCDNETRAVQVIIVDDTIPPDVIVPWTEDTLYLDCLSAVPPVVYPTVSDNCAVKDTTRTIETVFGACMNDRWIRRTWRFRDFCDNEAIAVQIINVKDSMPPDIIVPWPADTVWIECASAIPTISEPSVSDNCGVRDTTFTRVVSDSTCINHLTIDRIWEYSDSCDNISIARHVTIVNDDTPPEIIVPWPADTVWIECASAIPAILEPSVSDNCSLKDTIFARVVSDSTCINHLTIDRIWEYSDSCNNTSIARHVIIINDDIPPITLCNDTILELDEFGTASIVVEDLDGGTTDNCGFNLSASQLVFDCSDVGENMITLTATDSCNNEANCIAMVTVEDNIFPTVVANNIVIFLDENGYASITVADVLVSADDNCGILDISLSMWEFSCDELGYNTVELIVTDISGNITITEIIVAVFDSIGPVMVLQDITIYLDENGNASISVDDIVVDSWDNCEIVSLTIDQHDFDCSHLGDNVVFAQAIDIGGNVSSDWAMVTVVDDIVPVVICVADTTIEIPEGQTYYTAQGDEFDPIDMFDNCNIDSVANNLNSDTTLAGEEFPLGTTTVTWSVEDQDGNWGDCSFDVTINVLTQISDHLLQYVRIYPNPTQSAVKIDLGNSYDRVTMIIKDIAGRVFTREEFENIKEIDLNIESYPNGVYFISLIVDRKLGNYRIIKH